jgi:hypothetical protein
MAVIDPIDPFNSEIDVSASDSSIQDLASQLGNYDQNFAKYQQRLAPYSYQAPNMSIYDLASELGAGLLATPNTGGASAFTGLGVGFTRVSDKMKKNQEANAKAQQQIGLQAAQLAMQDEQKAIEFLNQYAIKKIDSANKKVDYITFEYDEVDETTGTTTTQSQTFANIPSNRDDINDIINNKNGREVKPPTTAINMPGDNTSFADKEAIKSMMKESDAYEAKSKASDLIKDQVNQAFILANEIEDAGGSFGPLSKSTLGARELISGLGFGEFLLGESEAAIAPQKALNQLSMGFTMAIVSQTKGAISDREMKLFISASPTLGSTKEGYMKQLELLERLALRDRDFYNDYVDKMIEFENEGLSGRKLQLQLDKFTANWSSENPLFTPDEVEFLEKKIASGEGLADDFVPADFQVAFNKRKAEISRKKAILPTVKTQDDYDDLEKGDEYVGTDGQIYRKP